MKEKERETQNFMDEEARRNALILERRAKSIIGYMEMQVPF
jgi:hypothetical protein